MCEVSLSITKELHGCSSLQVRNYLQWELLPPNWAPRMQWTKMDPGRQGPRQYLITKDKVDFATTVHSRVKTEIRIA